MSAVPTPEDMVAAWDGASEWTRGAFVEGILLDRATIASVLLAALDSPDPFTELRALAADLGVDQTWGEQ